MTTAPVLELRPVEVDDEPAVVELLTESLGSAPTGMPNLEFFRWKHRDSPFGASPGLVAVHDGRIVGVRLFLRWRLVTGSRTLEAVRAVDTATHPDFQRQGIFRRLTVALLEQLDRDERIDLVFNTPNADSRPGYLRLGWQEVGLLPVHIAPVRPLAFLRGARGASTANASGSASAVAGMSSAAPLASRCPLPPAATAFTDVRPLVDLLEQRATTPQLHTPLDVDYLRWRYVDVPGLDYRCVPVRQGGELVGIGFGRVRRRANLTELTLGDVIVRAGDRRAARRVLRAARCHGVDHVAVHAAGGTETSSEALRSGYLRVPQHGIGLVANPRRGLPVDVFEPRSWRLSLGDLEVY